MCELGPQDEKELECSDRERLTRTSMVVQWLRHCLVVQEPQV